VLKVKVHPPTRRVKFGGDWRWGGEKVACWSTKATISLKRVNVAEKLLWRACMNSPTLFRTVPSQTSYGLLFPKIGVRNPTQNPNIAIISGVGEVTASDFKFGWNIHRVYPNTSPWAYSATVQIFGYPLLSQERVKLRTSNSARIFTASFGKAH